jgi:adenylosuccinate lyase
MEHYATPLGNRWKSPEMSANFSDRKKYGTWRRLWTALAECQKELGLDITEKQIRQMKEACDNIDFDAVAEDERKNRHEVMAHLHVFAAQCPDAGRIMHLGATSAFVMDNADLIIMRDALNILLKKVVNCIAALAEFAGKRAEQPTLGFTHFQPAQLTTVGKRACLWIQDLIMDVWEVEYRLDRLAFRGAKGTTGTQASFLQLFDGDGDRVERLDRMLAERMGFKKSFDVTGQTYPRKVDSQALATLSALAQSAHKFACDMRLLQHLGEIQEPFGDAQVGSSAMPYKRNPMRAERMASLSEYVINIALNPAHIAANQWFERTLDDSANRRLTIPEAFIAADVVFDLYLGIARGLVVNESVIDRHVSAELPFMASEAILMEAVKAGGDRQEMHEKLRGHAMEAARGVKEHGRENDFVRRVSADPAFAAVKERLSDILRPEKFVGLAPRQTRKFLENQIRPITGKYRDLLGAPTAVDI